MLKSKVIPKIPQKLIVFPKLRLKLIVFQEIVRKFNGFELSNPVLNDVEEILHEDNDMIIVQYEEELPFEGNLKRAAGVF